MFGNGNRIVRGDADVQDVDSNAAMLDLDDTTAKIDLNVMAKESQIWFARYGRSTHSTNDHSQNLPTRRSGWTRINKREGIVISNCREEGMSQRSSPTAAQYRQRPSAMLHGNNGRYVVFDLVAAPR
jgi:hypothetical protein